MGRPRKPTSLKILDGDRADRINGDEPASTPGIGEPPDWLDRFGREAWARLVEAHRPSAMLTGLDVEAATLYAQSYSCYRHALATITADLAESPPKPFDKVHPAFRLVNESFRQMTRILSKFGMSPSDRAGLHVQERPEDDALLAYIAGKSARPTDGKRKRKGQARD